MFTAPVAVVALLVMAISGHLARSAPRSIVRTH